MVENNKLFIAFLHAKSFATPVLVVVVFSSLLTSYWCFTKGMQKALLSIFYHLLHRKRVAKIGLISLDTLKKVSVTHVANNKPCVLT